MKKIFFVVAVIFIASVVFCTLGKNKNVEVNMVSDLTALFGYDFASSKDLTVYNKQVEGDATCVCVVLEGNMDCFMNDEFIKNTGFSGDNGNELYFSKLKSAYPDMLNFDYEQTQNHGFNMRDYVFKSLFVESAVPCSIYWFSANMDNTEKIVIYSFFPFSVDVKHELRSPSF